MDTECIQCSESSFNIDTKECQKCPEGQIIDLKNHVCVTPSEYVTNPHTAPNLLFDGISEQEIIANYDNEKESNENVADCQD